MNQILNFDFSIPENLIEIFLICSIASFFSILFIQSSFDKIFNFDENLNFLKAHFKHTFFSRVIYFIFFILIFFELITGLLLLIVLISTLFISFNAYVMQLFIVGMIMVNVTLLSLFLGQRIAKDYAGAASLTGYFLIALLGLFFFL